MFAGQVKIVSHLSCRTQARRKQLQIGGAHIIFFTDWGGTHKFFEMTDLCNEQYSIFVQIIGGARPPVPPLYLPPWDISAILKFFVPWIWIIIIILQNIVIKGFPSSIVTRPSSVNNFFFKHLPSYWVELHQTSKEGSSELFK